MGEAAAGTSHKSDVLCTEGNLKNRNVGYDANGNQQAKNKFFGLEADQHDEGGNNQDDACTNGEPSAEAD